MTIFWQEVCKMSWNRYLTGRNCICSLVKLKIFEILESIWIFQIYLLCKYRPYNILLSYYRQRYLFWIHGKLENFVVWSPMIYSADVLLKDLFVLLSPYEPWSIWASVTSSEFWYPVIFEVLVFAFNTP